MPLDTSIPLQAKAPEFNPLQQALQVAQFRYMNANGQAMQQQLDANRAVSAAYQQATDPTTGQVDNNKLMGIISQDPRAAYNMGQIAQGINTQKQQQTTLNAANFDLAMKQNSFLNQRLGSIDPADPNFQAQVMQTAGEFIHNYGGDPQKVSGQLADLPPLGSSPQQNSLWLQRHLSAIGAVGEQLKALQPQFTNVNTGPATVAVNTNPLAAGGVGSVGYTVQNGLSPSEAQSPGITLNKSGQPVTYTKGQMQAGEVPQLPGGGYATGAPLGAGDVAAGAATRYNTLQTAAAQAKPMMQTYDLANQAVQGAIAAGKGSASIANARGTVQTILGAFHIAPTGDSVKDYQLAVNYLNSAADQAASSLGLSGSDSRLAAAKAGQPDPNNMNLPALQESIAHAKGLQQALLDRQQAATNFLAQNGNNTSQLPQFEAKWNQAFNPDVSYIRSLADPAQQQAAMQQLKAQGKLQGWVKDYQAMKALGAF
ncbi:hypothetical protein [Burkholderia vietnamiensis]|uniref:hypothetical protein n=1 Tax=Burkholderia vietnamiensis TaxID=60552 RepID=UPI00265068C6|nr:hypothetical protein [Burkholderia vietnamiensis]MDN8066336.1 hypothetical protein [Burkholderia vietnamiensis]